MALRIEVIPPFVGTLQVTSKPCHDGVVPQHALVVVGHEVVFAFHLDELYRLAQYLQGIEELYAFADGHIGVYGAVEQQQWSVDFVGIEERTLLGE